MIDTTRLKELDIKEVYQALGFEVRGNGNARCFGTAHTKGDRNPSLGFDRKTNRFKCFACGIQGDTIELVQQVKGTDFKQSSEWLASVFGVKIDDVIQSKSERSYIDRKEPIKRVTNYQLEPIRNPEGVYQLPENTGVIQAFYKYTSDPDDKLLAFWHKRGLSDQLLKQAGWRTIIKATYQKLLKDYTSKQLYEAGLLSERANGYTPLFYKHTVAVPFYDGDQLIYLRARSLDPTVKAKYLAPRNTSPPIYNYQALMTFTDTKPLYITESETDALALTELGHTALALVGGQKHPDSLVVRELVEVIAKGFSRKMQIRIASDRDKTGDAFFDSVASALYLAGIPSENIIKWRCEHPEHKDIGECLASQKGA